MALEVKFSLSKGPFTLRADLQLPTDQVTGIFGPSGCGKTTFLRAIAGLETRTRGFCQFNQEIWQNGSTFIPTHHRGVGYVFQQAPLFDHLSVRQNLKFALKRARRGNTAHGFEKWIELLGLSSLLSKFPSQLSGGQKQRVAIARSLLANPKLLLMDEPLASLDETAKQSILPLLKKVHRWLTIPILYVSHSMEEISLLSDYMALMEQGRIVSHGTTANLLVSQAEYFARLNRAESVLYGQVTRIEEEYGLTYFETAAGEIAIPKTGWRLGERGKIRVLAKDVSLTLYPSQHSSILNSLKTQVDHFSYINPAQVLVRLKVGKECLLSIITKKSWIDLNLSPGKEAYAQVKGVATET